MQKGRTLNKCTDTGKVEGGGGENVGIQNPHFSEVHKFYGQLDLHKILREYIKMSDCNLSWNGKDCFHNLGRAVKLLMSIIMPQCYMQHAHQSDNLEHC